MNGVLGVIRRMHEYERWAGARVAESLRLARDRVEGVGEAAEAAPLVRAAEVFGHIQAARRLWLSRLAEAAPPEDGLFPSPPLDESLDEMIVMDGLWDEYLSRLEDGDVREMRHWVATDGTARTGRHGDILLHLVNHGSYHRGQIARLVAECGVDPAVTDFIYFAMDHPQG